MTVSLLTITRSTLTTNMNFSANWRSIFSEKLTANFSFGYDHYDYRNDETVEEQRLHGCRLPLISGLGKRISATK